MTSRTILALCKTEVLYTFTRNRVAPCSVIAKRHFPKTKHWDPKYREMRQSKWLKIELPDVDEIRNTEGMSPEEMRSKMKEKGIAPPRAWMERPILISSTGGVFEPYIPPEGDGRITSVSVVGAKQRLEWLQKKGKSMMSLKKIRNFDEEFEVAEFANKAQEIYVDTHRALAENDEDKLHDLVTESCFPQMMSNIHRKTVAWDFVSSLEPPRVVHIRCTEVVTKENVFAQMTVRIHSKQILAVYDRFGRLMYGSTTTPKDVLEYVVFEKHLPNQYGQWRIHAKIIPDWMPPKESPARTFRNVEIEEPPPPPKPETEDEEPKTTEKQPPLTAA